MQGYLSEGWIAFGDASQPAATAAQRRSGSFVVLPPETTAPLGPSYQSLHRRSTNSSSASYNMSGGPNESMNSSLYLVDPSTLGGGAPPQGAAPQAQQQVAFQLVSVPSPNSIHHAAMATTNVPNTVNYMSTPPTTFLAAAAQPTTAPQPQQQQMLVAYATPPQAQGYHPMEHRGSTVSQPASAVYQWSPPANTAGPYATFPTAAYAQAPQPIQQQPPTLHPQTAAPVAQGSQPMYFAAAPSSFPPPSVGTTHSITALPVHQHQTQMQQFSFPIQQSPPAPPVQPADNGPLVPRPSLSVAEHNRGTRRQLMVHYLSPAVNSTMLAQLFAPFGKLQGARIIYDRHTNQPRGYGFVYFEDSEDAQKAQQAMNGVQVHGKWLKVEFTNNPLHVFAREDGVIGHGSTTGTEVVEQE